MEDSLVNLQQKITEFAKVRDWEQFHSPKNLSMALIGEAAELLEHFQWLTQAQSQQLSKEKHQAVGLEMADIFIYLLRLAETLDIDLIKVSHQKAEINEQRFPIDLVKGKAKRAIEYQ